MEVLLFTVMVENKSEVKTVDDSCRESCELEGLMESTVSVMVALGLGSLDATMVGVKESLRAAEVPSPLHIPIVSIYVTYME